MSADKVSKQSDALETEKPDAFDAAIAYEHLDDSDIQRDAEQISDEDNPNDANPQSGSSWGERLERTTRVIASLSVAAAALISAMQYKDANTSVRSARSFEFVEQWQTKGVDGDFAQVQQFVEARLDRVGTGFDRLEGEARAHALNNLGRIWVLENRVSPTPENIEENLDSLTIFFSQFEVCIAASLCEGDVLKSYFDSEVVSFWGYFSGYADLRREAGYQNYGASVDNLVARFKENDS